jgi:hypothetical protein
MIGRSSHSHRTAAKPSLSYDESFANSSNAARTRCRLFAGAVYLLLMVKRSRSKAITLPLPRFPIGYFPLTTGKLFLDDGIIMSSDNGRGEVETARPLPEFVRRGQPLFRH